MTQQGKHRDIKYSVVEIDGVRCMTFSQGTLRHFAEIGADTRLFANIGDMTPESAIDTVLSTATRKNNKHKK